VKEEHSALWLGILRVNKRKKVVVEPMGEEDAQIGEKY